MRKPAKDKVTPNILGHAVYPRLRQDTGTLLHDLRVLRGLKQMAILNKAVALFRAARLTLHIGYGLLQAISYPWFGLSLRRRILQNWSVGLLDIFNVRINIGDNDPIHDLHHGLIVTNHISWLDVFVLNAVVRCASSPNPKSGAGR